MKIAVDISLYPLDADFLPPIRDVIARLNEHNGLEVVTNPMSTQVRGDYDVVMAAVTQEVKTTFAVIPKAIFAIKILNNPAG